MGTLGSFLIGVGLTGAVLWWWGRPRMPRALRDGFYSDDLFLNVKACRLFDEGWLVIDRAVIKSTELQSYMSKFNDKYHHSKIEIDI